MQMHKLSETNATKRIVYNSKKVEQFPRFKEYTIQLIANRKMRNKVTNADVCRETQKN